MDVSKMKNMVVLKNLPSNIIDEAFVVLKANKKVKKLEVIENHKNKKNQEEIKKDKEYVLKEAEMLVNDYISKIESKPNKKTKSIKDNPKRIKTWAYVSTVLALLEGIVIISS